MKLPCADEAVIEVAKLRDYLLSPAHPVGRFKAVLFAALGYTAENWRELEADLRALAESADADPGRPSRHGEKYEVCGMLGKADTKRIEMVTVWIIRSGENVPRFVTAHPREKP